MTSIELKERAMMAKMTKAEAKGRAIIAGLTLRQIVKQFELTERMTSEESYRVRGWYMDELEKRNPAAFEDWIMGDEPSPRRFFLKGATA